MSKRTKRELIKFMAELQARLERRVTFDEAIMFLLAERRRRREAREELRRLKGVLAGKEEEAFTLLRELRAQGEEKLEKLQRTTREALN